MPSPPITTLLWDNDGVLVDTEALYFQATRETLARAGVELTLPLYRQHFLLENRGAWHLAAERGMPPGEIEALKRDRGVRYSELIDRDGLAIPGALDTLEALRGRYRMGVVTSSHREHFERIHARTGMRGHFDFVVTSEDVAHTKPDPEPYRKGMALAAATPAECVVIEDSERGLIAARAAGVRCLVIPSTLTAGQRFEAAERVLLSIREVPEALAALGR